MNIPPLDPVFGFVQELLTLVVLLIGVITFLAQQFGQTKPPVQPPVRRPGRPARPRDDRLQDEIDIFLQEAAQPRPGQTQAETASQRPTNTPPSPPRRRRTNDESSTPTVIAPPSSSRRSRTVSDEAGRRRRKSEDSPAVKLTGPDSFLGGGSERGAEPGRTLSGEPTYQDVFATTPRIASPFQTPLAVQVRKVLRDPKQVKQAILINEILALPKGRRR